MPSICAYHRPCSLDDAIALLTRSGVGSVVLGGGTRVVGAVRPSSVEVIDLQALGLGGISTGISAGGDRRLCFGAMATLADVADDERVPDLLRDLARREAPSTLRTLATVGGTVAEGDPDSQMLAGLLVFEARVSLADAAGSRQVDLAELLKTGCGPATVVTAVEIATDGATAAARTGRTPADVPIVAAIGRRAPGGPVRIACTGVATTPVVVDDPGRLQPPGDFRGTATYRRHLATTLIGRVMEQLS